MVPWGTMGAAGKIRKACNAQSAYLDRKSVQEIQRKTCPKDGLQEYEAGNSKGDCLNVLKNAFLPFL